MAKQTELTVRDILAQAKEFMTSSRQALRWVWQELMRIQQETEQDKTETLAHIEKFIKDLESLQKEIDQELK